ncbi:unnamed protein product [Closterium sp. Naga37s-1]|nr:unnamed protein product [Closterium sp. Naga37s-1]
MHVPEVATPTNPVATAPPHNPLPPANPANLAAATPAADADSVPMAAQGAAQGTGAAPGAAAAAAAAAAAESSDATTSSGTDSSIAPDSADSATAAHPTTQSGNTHPDIIPVVQFETSQKTGNTHPGLIPVVQFLRGEAGCFRGRYMQVSLRQALLHNTWVILIGPRACREEMTELGIELEAYEDYEESAHIEEQLVMGIGARARVSLVNGSSGGFPRILCALFPGRGEGRNPGGPSLPDRQRTYNDMIQLGWYAIPTCWTSPPDQAPATSYLLDFPSRPSARNVQGQGEIRPVPTPVWQVPCKDKENSTQDPRLYGKFRARTRRSQPSIHYSPPLSFPPAPNVYLPPWQCKDKEKSGQYPRMHGKFKPAFKAESLCAPRQCEASAWSDAGWCAFDNNFSVVIVLAIVFLLFADVTLIGLLKRPGHSAYGDPSAFHSTSAANVSVISDVLQQEEMRQQHLRAAAPGAESSDATTSSGTDSSIATITTATRAPTQSGKTHPGIIPVVQFLRGEAGCNRGRYMQVSLRQALLHNTWVILIGPRACREEMSELGIELEAYEDYEEAAHIEEQLVEGIGKVKAYHIRWFFLHEMMVRRNIPRVFYTDCDVLLFVNVTQFVQSHLPESKLALCVRSKSVRINATSGHVSLWSTEALADFLAFFVLFFQTRLALGMRSNSVRVRAVSGHVSLWSTEALPDFLAFFVLFFQASVSSLHPCAPTIATAYHAVKQCARQGSERARVPLVNGISGGFPRILRALLPALQLEWVLHLTSHSFPPAHSLPLLLSFSCFTGGGERRNPGGPLAPISAAHIQRHDSAGVGAFSPLSLISSCSSLSCYHSPSLQMAVKGGTPGDPSLPAQHTYNDMMQLGVASSHSLVSSHCAPLFPSLQVAVKGGTPGDPSLPAQHTYNDMVQLGVVSFHSLVSSHCAPLFPSLQVAVKGGTPGDPSLPAQQRTYNDMELFHLILLSHCNPFLSLVTGGGKGRDPRRPLPARSAAHIQRHDSAGVGASSPLSLIPSYFTGGGEGRNPGGPLPARSAAHIQRHDSAGVVRHPYLLDFPSRPSAQSALPAGLPLQTKRPQR